MSWERGHLARTGPKARKAPTGATCPSHPLPRPRRGPGSDGGLPEAQASRPLDVAGLRPACGRDARAPRGPWEWCPGSAGILPAPGRRPAKRRQERHTRATHSPTRGVVMGVMGSPGSAGVARLAMWRACGPLAGGTPALPGGPGSDVLGARASCPRRPARRRQEARKAPMSWERGHLARTGPGPQRRQDDPPEPTPPPEASPRGVARLACGGPAARFRPGSGAMSWERGHLARNGPKARKAPTGATHLSRLLPRPRRGDGSDGVSRKRRRRPLGDVAGLRPACGRDARAPRGPWERCPGSAGILPAPGRRPARRRQERHP